MNLVFFINGFLLQCKIMWRAPSFANRSRVYKATLIAKRWLFYSVGEGWEGRAGHVFSSLSGRSRFDSATSADLLSIMYVCTAPRLIWLQTVSLNLVCILKRVPLQFTLTFTQSPLYIVWKLTTSVAVQSNITTVSARLPSIHPSIPPSIECIKL